jgi:subtilase family serine protease
MRLPVRELTVPATVSTSSAIVTSSIRPSFTDAFGLPSMNYARILEGPNPGIDALDTESELDMQWAHVGAPGASIDFYLGSDLIDDITGAINDNACGAISVSHTFYGVASSFIMNVMDPPFQ